MSAEFKTCTRQVSTRPLGVAATTLTLMGLQPEAAAQTRSEAEDRNKATVRPSFGAWRAGTGSPYDLLAEEARWTIEGYSLASKSYPSREAFMREVIRPFNARMQSPLKATVRNFHTGGDTVVVFFDAQGIARDGQPYANTYACFLDMRADRIVEASAVFDAIEFDDLWQRVAPAH